MDNTIKDLFNAIHYCNKAVKCDEFQSYELKRLFYHMKRDLLYHIIKNYKTYDINITECTIDLQPSNVKNGTMNRLYAFCLTYEDTELRVHQKEYSKLVQLFDLLDIEFTEGGNYCPEPDANFKWSNDSWLQAIGVVKEFYERWHLNELVHNLCDKTNDLNKIYDSFVYYHHDFKFTLEKKGDLIGKHTVVQVRHINSGRIYRIVLDILRAKGELILPKWRTQHKMFNFCLQ